ncbi:MAG: sn-glycerol-3-phosphate ABC transporter ATP-binding protein UgpC [Chloroflexi bacterium]|nr:sn-glycerol-3-phosphate ABC transporter ATP-binding protein UgpC [Chloroflexota bacterium]
MANVICRQLTKLYGDTLAVKAIDLEVFEGEFLVIVGPSGCGKTTTLRMIAGLESISDGEILIDGKVVNKVEPRHRDIAMVFQNYALYPHKKVYDNIAYPLQLRRVPKDEIRSRVVETSRLLGIEPLLERRIRQLSGGERQRVALGRAIIRQPRLFLMDEPLSNLDAQLRIQMRREIIRLQRQLGITTVYVTHDQVEAMTMGDRIVVMRGGLVQQIGEPMTIYNHPANRFVARFIGSPPMNLFDGVLENRNDRLVLCTGFAEYALPAQVQARLPSTHLAGGAAPVVCGMRAEDMTVDLADDESDNHALGVVDLVEPLGSDVFVSVKFGEEMLLARTAPDLPLRETQKVCLKLNLAKMHFFDPKTEQNLLR